MYSGFLSGKIFKVTDLHPANFFAYRHNKMIVIHVKYYHDNLFLSRVTIYDFLLRIMSIKQYFKPNIDKDIEIDIISQHEESASDIDIDLEDIELPRKNTQINYKKSKKRAQLTQKKTGNFQKEWLGIYAWLIYDLSKNLMFCSLCQAHKKQNKFGKEGDNFLFIFYNNLFYFIN